MTYEVVDRAASGSCLLATFDDMLAALAFCSKSENQDHNVVVINTDTGEVRYVGYTRPSRAPK